MPDNVDKLFEIMQAKGAASDRGKFRKVFLTPGNKGYKIRKDIYDGLRADGIIDSPTYEDFRRKLRLGGTPTVNKYRQQMFNSVDPHKSRASELTRRAVGQAVRATNNVRKPVTAKVVNQKGKPTGEEFAITPAKTVEDLDREYAQETTKNWENELHDQIADADKDAAKISDMFKSFIGSTDEVGSVWGNMTRGGGIAGTPHSVTTNNGILENTKARQILAAGDYNRKRRELLQLEQDSRLSKDTSLLGGVKKAYNDIKNGEFSKAGKDLVYGAGFDNHSFFRGMYDAAKDTGFLTGGASDLINAGSLLATKQDLDNGIHTEAGDMLMQQAVKNSNAQSQYGDNQGWMYTGGVITTNMAPFMVQIGSAGFSKGMSNAIGKVVQGAASKVALGTMEKATGMAGAHIANYIGKVTGLTTKAFGKAIQYGIVGAAQANTVGLGNVANDVINRYTGQVYQDEQGNYKFGTFDSDGKLVHEGGEDFLTALVKGEAAQTIEFATELAGGGIDAAGTALKNFVTKGGKKIINKYNMENVSKVIDFLLNNKVSKNVRYLKAGADRTLGKVEVNSIVGESLEEELGIIANTVFTGDNKISDLWDEKQQSQIWGGMLLSIGLMKGSVAPFHAYNAKQYYSYKHKLDKADVNLSQLLGKEKWEELRNQIDATTNDDMPEMVNKINRDVALGKNRQPVREYIQNLLIMRGYDIGNMLAAKKAVEDKGEGVSVKNMEKNQAYQQGRDAYGYDTHEIQLDQEDKQKSLAQLLGISEQQLASMSDEELEALSGRDDNIDRAIYDYQLSTARYEGVIDNARDQIDLEVQRAAQAVDMYTDKSRNTIRNATIKATGGLEDYGVYIINGNIATHEDGSIDISNSDDMILYYDPTTNMVEHADAMMFAELGSEENADEVRSQAMADAKEKAIKETTGIIDGVVEVGTQFKTVDADGTEHTYEVLADNGDGTAMITIDGNIPTELVKGENVNVPVSFEELQKMKDASDQQRLQEAKAQREQMEKERAEQQTQQTEETQPSFDFNQILNDNGSVVLVDVLDKDGNTRYPDSRLFLIRDAGAKAKVVELKSDGTIVPHAVNKEDVATISSMPLDEYKQAMPATSMIEDNSGVDRGEIEVEAPTIEDAEPIGTGAFGNIYNQFKGKVKEAFNFLMSHKSGDLLGVFHRDDVGDIDLVWGNEKMGLAHILGKHVGEGKDFETPDDAIAMIENVINSGRIFQDNQNRYTLMLDGVGVGIRKSFDGEKKNWIVTAVDFNRSQEEKGIVTNPTSTSHGVTESESAAALNDSDGKDINNSANDNENNESLTFEDGTPIPVDENGETDLSQTDAAHAAEWYDNNLGEDADDWLDGEIKKAKKVLEQAQNKKVTGTKPSELVASKKEKEAAIADAQAHYDSAISIRDSLKERRIAKKENTAEGRKELIEKARRKFARLKSAVKDNAEAVAQLYKETVGTLLHRLYDGTGIDVTDTIPLTAEEYVASNLGAHSLNYEGTETSKGVKQETGLSREDFAKTQLLAADGKGTTIDALVHSLWENRPSNLDSLDTQDIRNAMLSVITSGFKASEAKNYIENLRIAQAEKFKEEEKKAADNAAFAEENKAESEQQTETATESEEKTGEENSDEINDKENEKINEQTNENINAPEVPEDATEENPLGLQLSEDKVPFEIEGGKSGETYNINDNEDRQRLINDNKVDDKDILDIDMPKHVHKAIKELCKKMGLKVQFLYMGARSNGWIENGTMYLALDTEKATQFVFGHEMTHAIKQKNPEAYKELVKVAMAVTTRKKFEEDLAKVYQNYYGISGYNNIDDYVEEVVADNLGKFINDFDLAQKFSLRLNHPVLATILHAIQKIKSLLYGDFYKSVDALERIVEKAYVDTAKGQVTNSETGEDVSFSLRQKPEPKKKGIGYKVFVLKDGKLYPPMVANPDGAATPVGVWLDADAAPIAGESKTGRPQVKQGGKGTQGGSGKLAYRPGWHLGVVPYAIQFNRKDAEGNKTLFPKNFVFAEVEYAADVDYQEEARQEGINPSGKYQHSLAGLKHLPTDGYYMYRTNPNPETDPWVITGAMKVNRILTRAEQADLVSKAGREPQQIQEGDIVTDDVVNSINQEIADAPKFSLKVYHGSGADFTEFDFDHMGEGAGSQVFGWGGYVTSSKKIGKDYASIKYDPDKDVEYVGKNKKTFTDLIATLFDGGIRDYNYVKNALLEISDNDKSNISKKEEYDWFVSTKPEDWFNPNPTTNRNLYEVNIPEDNGSNYLEWEKKPSDEVATKIIEGLYGLDAKTLDDMASKDIVFRTLLYDYIKNADKEQMIPLLVKTHALTRETTYDNGNVEDDIRLVYNRLSRWMGSPKAASQFLSSLGFTGIKYPAGTIMGGAEEGDTNYVIFKPEDMRITEHTKFSLKDPFKMSDNEKKERGDRLIKAPAVDVASGVIQKTADLSARKAAEKWWNENVAKPLVFNTEIGDVEINDKSIKDSLAHRYRQPKLDAITSLPDGFGNAVYLGTMKDFTRDGYVNNHYFAYPINYDGQRNYVFCRAMQDANKNRLYVHEVFVADKINEGNTLQTTASQPHGGIALYKEILANVLSAAKIDNSSETAKENGEKVDVEAPKTFDEFLNHPSLKFSIKNEQQRKAAEDAYEYASKLRPNKSSQYALVDMSNPSSSPEYYEKKVLADRWRRFYNKAVHNELDDVYKDAWGNYKLFDLDRPFADQVNEVKGDVPDEFNAPDVVANKNADNESGAEYHEYKQDEPSSITYKDRYKAFKQRVANSEKTAGLRKERKEVEDSYNSKSEQRIAYNKQLMKEYMDKHGLSSENDIPYDVWEDLRSKSFEKYQDELDSLFNKYKDLDRQIKAVAEPRFSLKDEKTLAGVHNISEEKLLKAIKQGGLANPSVAVIDSSKQDHKAYGDISLILPSDKIAKRTGKNAGTWQGDAYTPTYPEVEKQMSNKGAEKSSSDVLSVPKEMQHEVRNGIDRWLNGGDANSGLKYLFLHEKGVAPEPKMILPKFSDEAYNELKSITDGNFNIHGIGKADARKVLDMYIEAKFDGDKALYEEKTKAWLERNKSIVDAGAKGGMRYAIAKENVELYDEYGFNYKGVQTFVRDVEYDHRKTGVDMNATLNDVEDYIKTNNLTDEFNTWLEGKEKEYGIKEVIFEGFTPSGNRRYVPNTLENVSKIMKKQGRNGATGAAVSFQNFAARLMPSYGTLKDIRSKKGLLTSDRKKFDDFREKWSNVFFELGMKCQPDATGTFDDYGLARLSEAAMTSDPQAYLKKEYNVDFSDADTKRLKEMVKAIKEESPAMYFETKFERPVRFDEFSAAVVPTTTKKEVKEALKNAGVSIFEYDEKSDEDRSRAFNEAINSSDNIRFSLAGERGAAAADKADERTFRMDNLSVAKDMEKNKKKAKAIKAATGWERGADGKWRYEMPDVVLRDPKEWVNKKTLTLSDIVEKPNDLFKEYPELFDAYPELKDMKILKGRAKSGGVFYNNAITLNLGDIREAIKYDLDTHYKLANNSLKKTLVHEIQHYIQENEGFAQGGNSEMIIDKNALDAIAKLRAEKDAVAKEFYAMSPEEQQRRKYEINNRYNDLTKQIERLEKSSRIGYDGYNRLSGEVEARNVSARMNMTPEDRRKTLAEYTEDVARKDQILLGVGDVSFSLRDMADGKESGAADMAEDLKSLNTPDEVDDAIKTAIEDMPSGWKMANKKMIHIAQALGENRKAEIAGEEPKFSLKDGSLIKAGTYFSGGGLVEEGLKGIIDPVVAVEYDEKISGVYRNNFGQHIVTADVRDVDPKELVKQIDGEVEYFHASPVCKNYSQAKSNHAEVELDKETAASTAEFINAIKPKVVTIENVKGYKDSDAMKTITDALDANGYTWDADVYNAADYGGYTNRERLIVRAVRDGKLPAKPKKMARKSGWYEAVADIIPTLTEKKNGVAPWMDIRLKADGIDWRNIDKPLYVMGSAYADGKVPHAFADELLPTLRTKSGDVIVMPDGKVYRAMGRVLARVSGVSDDYKMPFSENLSHTIIGNGIPTQLTEHVIAPLLQNTLRSTTPEDDNTKFSLRYDQFEHDLNQWKKDNNLPKDAQRPTIPQRNAGESAVDFLRRVDEYRKQMALWKTAPTYEQHLLSDDTALGEFNRELQRGSVLKRIAFQDSMLAIRKAQEAIMKEVGVDRLNMAEDAYTAENRSHGKGKNEFEEYNNEFLQPLRKAYHQMKKVLGDSYDNVRIYMVAKHGLERNAQMAFKKSLESDFDDVAKRSAAYRAYKGDMNRIINDSDLEFGRIDFKTWRNRDNLLRTKYSPSYMAYRYDENGIVFDYSGLSALFGGPDFEEAGHKLVRDIEDKYVTETHDLWDATNAATKKILRDGYKAGMMSKDTYQYVRDMYGHYIPLRGWDGTTADQVWDYIGGGKGSFNQTLKTAHGRTSIADDPIAYIENMAESGILLNNKNWVKQHLMLLAQNHPTSLLTLSKAWYVKSVDDNGNEEWIPATPQITSQMNSNQVKAAIDAFEQKMENMAQTGDATQQRDGLNIAYPQTHSEEREHEVRVMKDGEEYVIYVNGDPQLAQAMNNTRAHRVSEGIKNSISKRVIAVVGRKMAAAYTSLSPLFIPSNYFRDLTMTLASTAIREDAKYNYLLRKNLATSWNLGFMLRDYQNGKLRDKVNNGNATPKEQMFYDFMMNGGETGFVSSLDVEDLKKKFKNDLKDLDRWKANPVKVGHTIMDGIEFLNRAIEDSNRFAVYMTSIQYGRSIDEAVNDAKDVTLNFNRKGTGEYGWQMIRNLYLFINPAVQSLQTLGALAKHHPFKFTAVTASWLASGVLVPIVNAALMSLLGGDDDKDKYWQFTKWDRRNNFIMWVPTTHEFVKIPLAQEFRAFYGLGDMIASKMMGGELAEESWSQYAEDLLGQVVDMLPLDPTGYDGNIAVSLMPNAIRPVFELAFNVDFTGKPLFKETEYNKYDPNFTKAYVGTPDWLVRASKMVNSIGNDYPDVQQNSIDAFGDPKYNLNNPAVVDHVLSSYLGGAYTMGSQVLGVLTKSLNDPKEIKVADIPLFSKFVSNPDDRPVTKKQGDEFWNMKENHDRAANTLSKLKKQAKVDGDYSMLERFYGSEEYKQYKQDDVKVKKYEEDKKKERAEESGDEYRPHKLNAEDIYKAHATPKDDFEDLKLEQLYTKLNGFKTSYDLLVDTASSQSDGYYNTNKAAIDAIDEISLDKQEISELKKGFLDDGKDAYNAEDMKQIRELRKKILAVLEKANKVVVANQKVKTEK